MVAGKESTMTNREVILGRIREALKTAAPPPIFRGNAASPTPLPASPKKWLPPVGETLEEQIELFRRNVEELKAEFCVCASVSEAMQHVKKLAVAGGWKKIGR